MNRRATVTGSQIWVLVGFCALIPAVEACARAPAATTPTRPADSLQQLRDDINAITKGPGVQRAAWGIAVRSLERDERLIDLNPRTLLVPASIVKLISLASALDAVGWEFRFE